MAVPGSTYEDRLAQAIIAKATRFYVSLQAPLGTWGEMTEFGQANVRPDYQIQELLFGLRFRGVPVDLTTLVSTEDVIRAGLQADPNDFSAAQVQDVARALASACSWVEDECNIGVPFA